MGAPVVVVVVGEEGMSGRDWGMLEVGWIGWQAWSVFVNVLQVNKREGGRRCDCKSC